MPVPQKDQKNKQDPAKSTEEENWGVEGVDWEWDVDNKEAPKEEVKEPKEEDWGVEGVDWYWSGEDEDEAPKE